MVSSSLALLYFPSFHGGKQGSGPDRGLSPVEWRFSVRTFVCPPPLGHPARPEARQPRPEAQQARSEAQPASQVSGIRDGWLGLRPGCLGLRPGWMAQKKGFGWNFSPFYKT